MSTIVAWTVTICATVVIVTVAVTGRVDMFTGILWPIAATISVWTTHKALKP